MADLFNDQMSHPERTDGAFSCRLCADRFPHEDNDWCPAARTVVCEDCCRALMTGEQRMLAAVSSRRGHRMDAQDVVSACMQCDRLVRLVSERGPDGDISVRLPLH
jgi:hypothetical protein